ncbi:unnamed protein product [Owenia fusiformis]|uniref:Transcription initiation factor TFIID subunit 8 n=1 Tax=Owenia fusiformis TaxID=6347 RepID=A0A8S4P0J5_OWEFU|nr:unnamed protein product [Owenia fusiformis]
MASGPPHSPRSARRKAMKVAVSGLCCEVGFQAADENAIETLLEMMQSYVCELGRSAKAYTELACRTESMLTDVVMAMVEMGCDVQSLPHYAKRDNRKAFMPPVHSHQPGTPRVLQAGKRENHPTHVPDYLPPFPDPHTYVRTETHKQPTNDYQTLREKAANQKRDIERATSKFMAKTGETQKIFKDDITKESQEFLLISPRPQKMPYLDALLPKYHHDVDGLEIGKETTPKEQISGVNVPLPGTVIPTDTEVITDNPYLRPIKMPRLKKKGAKLF